MLLLASALGCAGARGPDRGSRDVGRRLALTAPDLGGREVDIGAAQGKVRVVDFWATWCEPCKQAMPMLDHLARELGPRGVEVFGISIDEDPARVREFLQAAPVSFAILWDNGARRMAHFDVRFMPTILIVDRHGIIRFVHQGWDEDRARRERTEVEGLLAEP